MKKLFLIMVLIIFSSNIICAEETDYRQLYFDMPVPAFSYVHNIDPGQYYDNKNSAYSIYPLFRLNSTIYFKTITIPPGYYALTPVAYKGAPYVLFKDNGLVKFIIPVYKKEIVPEGFYESHLPKPRLTFTQKVSKNFYGFIGKHFKSAQRRPQVKCYLEVNDLDNQFVSIIVYFGNYRYYTLFRTIQM